MKATICSEFGRYAVEMTSEELQLIYQSLKDSMEFLAMRTPKDLPKPYATVGELWMERRKKALNDLIKAVNHSRGIGSSLDG